MVVSDTHAHSVFERQARASLAELRSAIARLIWAVSGRAPGDADELPGANELARRLDLDPKLAWKLLHLASERGDELAAVRYVPGKVALERATKHAVERGAERSDAERVLESAAAFRTVSKQWAGSTRAMRLLAARHAKGLDAGDEAEQRRNAFDAFAFATGMRTQTLWWCFALSPAKQAGKTVEPREIAMSVLHGRLGLERLRRDALWQVFGTFGLGETASLAHRPLDPLADPAQGPPIVRKFCSEPTPTWAPMSNAELAPGGTAWSLMPGEVGEAGRMTVVFGERFDRGAPREAEARTPVVNSYQVAAAAELLVCVCLVHRGLGFRSNEPTLSLTLNDGGAELDDTATIPSTTRVEPGEVLPADAKCKFVPRSPPMVRWMLDQIDEPADAFDVYRVAIPWPLFGSIVRLAWL